MELEFEARIFQNKNNRQYSFIPTKKNLSKEVKAIMDNPNVKGFKLQIIKELEEMPPVISGAKYSGTKAERNNQAVKAYNKRRKQ